MGLTYTCPECFEERDDDHVPIKTHPWKSNKSCCGFCWFSLNAEMRDCAREDATPKRGERDEL